MWFRLHLLTTFVAITLVDFLMAPSPSDAFERAYFQFVALLCVALYPKSIRQ